MVIQELIDELSQIIEDFGNVEVFVRDPTMGSEIADVLLEVEVEDDANRLIIYS